MDKHKRSSDHRSSRRDRSREKRRSSPPRERSKDKSRREGSPRGRRSRRDETSRTPSRTPSYSPIYKDRKSSWDVMIATERITQPTSNPQNPHQLSQRRLYVGNLPDDVNEAQLLDFFNNAMIKANVVKNTGMPVTSVTIYRDKAYAFIELRTAEEANIGMSFEGISLHGKTLRVRRPKDYQPPSVQDVLASNMFSNASVSANVAESPNKIFVGGLPPHLNDQDVKKLLSMFGQLKSFNLVKDGITGVSKGFAFCEYSDPEVTDDACKALNGMTIGDKTLIVQRASVNSKHQSSQTTEAIIVNQAAANMLNLSMPAAHLLASAVKEPDSNPTRILIIMNIINTVDFPGDRFEEEFDELFDDIVDECSRYGNIKTVHIPRNPKSDRPTEKPKDEMEMDEMMSEKFPFNESDSDDIDKDIDEVIKETGGDGKEIKPEEKEVINVHGYGKVYIEFYDVEDAKTAQRALSGRRYDGRMVITSFLSEEKWIARILEPDSMQTTDQYNFIHGTLDDKAIIPIFLPVKIDDPRPIESTLEYAILHGNPSI